MHLQLLFSIRNNISLVLPNFDAALEWANWVTVMQEVHICFFMERTLEQMNMVPNDYENKYLNLLFDSVLC